MNIADNFEQELGTYLKRVYFQVDYKTSDININ